MAEIRENTCRLSLGIDVGSTTIKVLLLEDEKIIYESYKRHYSQVKSKLLEMLGDIKGLNPDEKIKVAISGSAGLGISEKTKIPFIQEVYATGNVVKYLEPDTSVVIELGGEDAKIIFFSGGTDERMNGTCAGGTGAFIDQMATLLNVTPDEMDKLSLNAKRVYPIASRCGVFAKSDIQPLLNQGARKEDIAASIYKAVVNQTIAGLAQGRKISGKVLFLGGPLYYCAGLRKSFKETLGLEDSEAVFPEYARFSVAYGAAMFASGDNYEITFGNFLSLVENLSETDQNKNVLPALFENEKEYEDFVTRHKKASVEKLDINKYMGRAYLGIDCGSTTTKLALISDDKKLLYTFYGANKGTPVEIVKNELLNIYKLCSDRIKICSTAVTGYGEDLIKHAFGVDFGIVETIAHYTAAKWFKPDVDFILDIGGQDIKCFKIRNGAIDSIMLNEACSSGCGSFIETFAKSLGYEVADFAKLGLFAKIPVNLGSRCTVFMNSSVKQSQKDGASIEDISAGLSVSVVKNSIYKVIRASSANELGKNIVVQGGTFLNDAVLRAFEKELGAECIRPDIAGLMGAYGAALYSMNMNKENSSLISYEDLLSFKHTSKSAVCRGCTNHCNLTVNNFGGKENFISGNQCQKPLGIREDTDESCNMYAYKRKLISSYKGIGGKRGKIGIPLALGIYEFVPLWYEIFTKLGFEVVFSGFSDKDILSKGQFSIPSDTICYPAKIMHGHIERLIDKGIKFIFYPCCTYNIKEKDSDNHYNCPVVAYYSELLHGNMDSLSKAELLYPYLNINNKRELARELYTYLSGYFPDITFGETKRAVKAGFCEYKSYTDKIHTRGQEILNQAEKNGKRVMVLAGRPYHIDPQVCHSIDKLACSLGFYVLSEDCISSLAKKPQVNVLNQWTYHSRLYKAAEYVCGKDNMQLVQLVSFGCGVDAITTDEVRRILEQSGKIYTQIKIDEITNLGAVKIRLRSLVGVLDEKERGKFNG